eukprot:TRINITY_DN2115_c0_g1_i1.p3 TRINITY_DN2115_c0_g1~~TRINITY_DN2115_c0_g1_i1.p3  ORF type:complete len:241 (+),score=92.08 TRINITY_DN2115_c0_g1_i1:1173-1895(+)
MRAAATALGDEVEWDVAGWPLLQWPPEQGTVRMSVAPTGDTGRRCRLSARELCAADPPCPTSGVLWQEGVPLVHPNGDDDDEDGCGMRLHVMGRLERRGGGGGGGGGGEADDRSLLSAPSDDATAEPQEVLPPLHQVAEDAGRLVASFALLGSGGCEEPERRLSPQRLPAAAPRLYEIEEADRRAAVAEGAGGCPREAALPIQARSVSPPSPRTPPPPPPARRRPTPPHYGQHIRYGASK